MDPVEQLAKFGVDPVRYFLLKEGSPLKDGGTLYVYSVHTLEFSFRQ